MQCSRFSFLDAKNISVCKSEKLSYTYMGYTYTIKIYKYLYTFTKMFR